MVTKAGLTVDNTDPFVTGLLGEKVELEPDLNEPTGVFCNDVGFSLTSSSTTISLLHFGHLYLTEFSAKKWLAQWWQYL